MYSLPVSRGMLVDIIDDDDVQLMWEEVEEAQVLWNNSRHVTPWYALLIHTAFCADGKAWLQASAVRAARQVGRRKRGIGWPLPVVRKHPNHSNLLPDPPGSPAA